MLDFKEKMKFKTVDNFAAFYTVKSELGSGAFGAVKLGQHVKTKMPCAIKIIKKQSLQVHQVYE